MGKPLVLIVDDEQYIRDMVNLKLASCGFDVKEATGGEDGIRKIKSLKPDIVLLDIEMPGMNGIQVLQELRKEDALNGTKIFLFTGKDNPRHDMVEISKTMAKEEGAIDLIRKETDLDKIAEYLKKSLGVVC